MAFPVSLLSLFFVAEASSTLAVVYVLAICLHHVSSPFPLLSTAANGRPERYIFALGLTVAAVLNVLLISFAFIRLWNVAGETEIAAVEAISKLFSIISLVFGILAAVNLCLLSIINHNDVIAHCIFAVMFFFFQWLYVGTYTTAFALVDAFHSGVFIALFVIRVVIVAVVTVLQYFLISLMGIGVAMLEENVREERELQDKNISMPCDTKTAEDETCANERRQTSSRIQQYAYLNQHPTDHYPIPLQASAVVQYMVLWLYLCFVFTFYFEMEGVMLRVDL